MSARGLKGFDATYAALFGDRWPALRESLTAPVRQVARLNSFAGEDRLAKRFPSERRENFQSAQWLSATIEPEADSKGVLDCYLMDLASVFPAVALDAQPGERVLDMCAAPGGKALIIAEAMKGEGELIANEISDNRRTRLARVIREYIPSKLSRAVQVTGHDAGRWCLHEKNAFDRILLDAPCSGERHLLEDVSEMKSWTEARSKNLSVRQYTLLASAIQSVKPGGRIVYSTCALSPKENDDVIARLLKRREGEARVLSGRGAPALPPIYPPPIGEPTDYGWMILPDTAGYGPIYFSILERIV